MTNGINNLLSLDLAVIGGAAKSLLFALFLPVLFPFYLWDCWSNEHEEYQKAGQKLPPALKDAPSAEERQTGP